LPATAASVSTRVVSWKLAAEIKGIRRERGLGNAEQQRTARGRTPSIVNDAIILLAEAELIHLFIEEEARIADILDFHPAHHLPNDGLDVLIVDIYACRR